MGQGETKPTRQTWQEWVPGAPAHPDDLPLLTRQEVLATTERLGVTPAVDERTLRYWEAAGIVPRPTLDYTSRGARAKYPWWMPDLLWHVRRYQEMGMSIEQLRKRIPAEARLLSCKPFPRKPFPRPHPQEPPSYETVEQRALRKFLATLGDRPHEPSLPRVKVGDKKWGDVTMEFPTELLGELDSVLRGLAVALLRSYGLAVAHVNVEFVTAEDEHFSLRRLVDGEEGGTGASEQDETTGTSPDASRSAGTY